LAGRYPQTRELLTDWPVDRQARWTAQVNEAETTEDLEQFRAALPHSDRTNGWWPVAGRSRIRPGRSACLCVARRQARSPAWARNPPSAPGAGIQHPPPWPTEAANPMTRH